MMISTQITLYTHCIKVVLNHICIINVMKFSDLNRLVEIFDKIYNWKKGLKQSQQWSELNCRRYKREHGQRILMLWVQSPQTAEYLGASETKSFLISRTAVYWAIRTLGGVVWEGRLAIGVPIPISESRCDYAAWIRFKPLTSIDFSAFHKS